jgi:hypothetical protein
MRTFSAQTSGNTTTDVIKYMATQRQVQNDLVKSGGGVTVPQFSVAGPGGGQNVNNTITRMASQQLKLDAGGQFNSCVGHPSSCSGKIGGTRKNRRRRRRYKRTRKSF